MNASYKGKKIWGEILKRRIIVITLLITIIVNMTGCGLIEKKPTRYQAQFLELFDTVTTIIGYADSKEEFSEFAQSVHDILEQYHELYDIYNDYEGVNNIKTINDNAGIAPVKVDRKIIDVLLKSKEAYTLSQGKKNIAFGAVLRVWHEYREAGLADPDNASLPDMELLKEKALHTDINKVIIDEEASTVYLEDPEMSLDVGAIAKGYATEQVVQQLNAKGYYNALISVGGNVRAMGSKGIDLRETDASGKESIPWSVGIQNPDQESDNQYIELLDLRDKSLVSSGDYERYYTVNGKRYHHIINPETLMPADYFTAVSIVTEDSGWADALTTVIFNMPYEDGLKLIEGLSDTEALWVFQDGSLKYTDGFAAYLKQDSAAE